MIALLLGIIALAIALIFSSSFDKLANEVRDIRIKCIKIDYLFKMLNKEAQNRDSTTPTNNSNSLEKFSPIFKNKNAPDIVDETLLEGSNNANTNRNNRSKFYDNTPAKTEDIDEEDTDIEEEHTNIDNDSNHNTDYINVNESYYDDANFLEKFNNKDVVEEFY